MNKFTKGVRKTDKIKYISKCRISQKLLNTVSVTFIYAIKLNSQLTENIFFFKIIKEKYDNRTKNIVNDVLKHHNKKWRFKSDTTVK